MSSLFSLNMCYPLDAVDNWQICPCSVPTHRIKRIQSDRADTLMAIQAAQAS